MFPDDLVTLLALYVSFAGFLFFFSFFPLFLCPYNLKLNLVPILDSLGKISAGGSIRESSNAIKRELDFKL